MKYLVISRAYYEPDNNTPRMIEWATIVELEPSEIKEHERKVAQDLLKDEEVEDAYVEIVPLKDIEKVEYKIGEEW